MKIILMVLLCFLFTLSIQAQFPTDIEEPSKVKKISLARKDSAGNIVENLEVFGVKDIPIYCYIDLNVNLPTMVRMDLIAVKAKGLRANSKFVSVKYKTKKGENSVSFNASPKKVWAIGNYRVDVFLDGKLEDSKEFKIEASK